MWVEDPAFICLGLNFFNAVTLYLENSNVFLARGIFRKTPAGRAMFWHEILARHAIFIHVLPSV